MFGSRHLSFLFCITLLWISRKTKAYVDVCESSPGTIYCNCEEVFYKDSDSLYKLTCIVLQNVTERDPVWRSLGDADNVSFLKLQPRLPVRLEYIPSEELRRMSKLKVLRIQEGNLGTLKSYAVSGFESLVELEIESNEITALEASAISGMPKLKKLTMSQNNLQELLADSLKDLTEVESLFLDRNNISRIEACAFCNLQNLKELELWKNQLSDLTEYTFRGLRYLKRLDLYRNKIRILNDKVFHSMPRLVDLDLRDNMITHIASRAFVGLEKLQSLALTNNAIKVLPDEVFLPLLSLRSLKLNNNKLEFFQREVIDNMKNSKESAFSLMFEDNPLKCDCSLYWVPIYLKLNQSHRLNRELSGLLCESGSGKENLTEYLVAADCKMSTTTKTKPTAPVVKFVPKPTSVSVPVELNSQKTKKSAATTEDDTGTYLSDVEQKASMDGSGAGSSVVGIFNVCYLALILYFHTSWREV